MVRGWLRRAELAGLRFSERSVLLRYGSALTIACAALLLRIQFTNITQEIPFTILLGGIFVSLWLFGPGPGMATLALSLLGHLLLLTDVARGEPLSSDDAVGLAGFISITILTTVLLSARRRARIEFERVSAEQREQARELELDQQRLQLAQTIGRIGTFEWNLETNKVTWTPELKAIYGLPDDYQPQLGETAQFIYSEDAERVKSAVDRVVTHGGEYNAQFRIARPDGQLRWLRARGRIITGLDGQRRFIGINMDITDSQRTLERLSEQTRLYRTILRAQSDLGEAFFIIEGNRIVYANEACRQISGYSVPELLAFEDFLELVAPHERPLIINRMADRLAGKEVENYYETRILHREGHLVDIEIAVQVITGPSGAQQLLVMGRDISQRKVMVQAGEVLASSLNYEQTLKNLARLAVPEIADWCAIDIVEDGELQRLAVVHSDPEKIALAHELQRRYPPDPSRPGGAWQVIKTGQPELTPQITEEMLAAAQLEPDILKLVKELGLRSSIIVPLRSQSQNIGALSLVMAESGRNFTRSDLALAEDLARRASVAIQNSLLHNRSEYLAAVVENTPEAIFSKDLEGKILSWNKGAQDMYGYGDAEMIGQSVTKLIPAERHAEFDKILETVKAGGGIRLETQRVTKKGRIIDVAITASPVYDPTGKIKAVSIVGRDITVEKEVERQKDEFIAIASHELKTPVTSMKVFAQTLRRTAERRGAVAGELGQIQAIEKQVDRLINLIKNILDVSRIGAKQMTLNYQPVLLPDFLTDAVEVLQAAFEAHNLVLGDIPEVEVEADPDRLAQVLTNLVTNACQHSPAGSEVVIDLAAADDQVVLSVRDSGEGIEPAEQKKLFDRFYQAHKTKTVGAGLGLYITQQIVDLHGGRIYLNSVPGQGSVFYVSLPLRRTARAHRRVKQESK